MSSVPVRAKSSRLLTAIALFAGALALAAPFPLLFRSFFLVVNLVTLAAFLVDKGRAKHGGRRISEATLHILTLAGGLLGAQLGRVMANHKTRKTSFNVVFVIAFLLWTLVPAVYCMGHR